MDSLLQLLEEESQVPEINRMYAIVILPLPLPKLFTYSIPLHFLGAVQRGIRVEVPFGKKNLYSGIVYDVTTEKPEYQPKPILSILDDKPIISDKQFRLWDWMSKYYIAPMGEVMNAALPGGLKLASETKIMLNPDFDFSVLSVYDLNNKESFLIEHLQQRPELTIDQVQELIQQKTVYPLLKKMFEKQYICISEELQAKYKPKRVGMVRLAEPYHSDAGLLKDAFALLDRATRQMEALMAYLQLAKQQPEVSRKELAEKANVDAPVLKKLAERGILELYDKEVSRLAAFGDEGIGNYGLSDRQRSALDAINQHFETKNAVLLHGVTGSGKTQVFVELMEQTMQQGKQVLYLLPEIALTAQIVGRLQKHFGDQIVVYHSRFNDNERVEVWKSAAMGKPIILGARSALFLPFSNLGLIIVDEEHDPSYKQTDPAPRYNARDTAVFLAHLYGAKTLLGTATPSLETYRNVQAGKYGLVEMKERFGGLALPDIHIVDIAEETRRKRMKSHFSPQLLEALQQTLSNGEQAILFQNRRGYAPIYRCETCAWTVECTQCDVSLTYHKHSNELHCHYCGSHQKLPRTCKACGSTHLVIQGFGTEKIEDELKIYLPDARLVRMDWDTVKGRSGHHRIIELFEKREVDILVGTQMVTKGLDFDNVGLVGVLSADQMLQFPDFRATERAYQLITQVAGRAGRKNKRGRVLIQAFNVDHPVLSEVQRNDFDGFLARELEERADFVYPPFSRLIQITLKHKKEETVEVGAKYFAEHLRRRLGNRVLGPATPGIARVRDLYIREISLKLGHSSKELEAAKALLLEVQDELKSQKGYSSVRILMDVDPY